MLNSIQEAIEEWAPKNWTNEFPEIRTARINKSTISIESLIDKFANRSIHCSIRVDESFFHCSFIGNRKGSGERMRDELEVIRNQERTKNQRETGFFETNEEQKQRIQREKIEAEEERKRLLFEAMVSEMRAKFQSNPESRFDYIKELGQKENYETTYVIELNSASVRTSGSLSAYPSKKFPEHDLHKQDSRCFYVGITWHTMEDRFSNAEKKNHMWNSNGNPRAGVVRRHRLINDEPPFFESLESLRKLTDEYGHNNNQRDGRVKKYQFEHYVAYALYMCGFRTWGPKISELEKQGINNMDWLGTYPFI